MTRPAERPTGRLRCRDERALLPGPRGERDRGQHGPVRRGPARSWHRRDRHRPAQAQGRGRAAGVPPRRSRPEADVAIGGHSFGGRVASLAAAEPAAPYLALVCFSYPLHPPGSPERTDARIAHWPAIRCPVLLLSGESDPFARIDLLRRNVAMLPHGELVTYPRLGPHAQAGPRRCPRSDRGIPARSDGALTRTRSAGPEPAALSAASRRLGRSSGLSRRGSPRILTLPQGWVRHRASPGPPHRRRRPTTCSDPPRPAGTLVTATRPTLGARSVPSR